MQVIEVNKNVLIELTPEQLQVVVAHLKKGVFEQVAPAINSIERQVIQQLQPSQETKKEQAEIGTV